MSKFLTIVVPVYNGSEYLDTLFFCLERQTVKDFELILVDDGSSDNSLEKMNSLAVNASFPVTVKSIEGSGVSVARNTGASLGTGKYLSFIDVDDRVTENYVEYLKKESRKNSFDVLFFQSERISEKGPFKKDVLEKRSKKTSGLNMLKRLAYNPTAFGVYNLFFKRDFFESGISFSEGYAYYEDYDLLFRVASEAKNIRYSKERLYFYIIQDGSAVATFSEERVKCISLLENLIPYFKNNYPNFSDYYEFYFISRIYWSLMWQASLAFTKKEALDFGKSLNMKEKMNHLKKHGDFKIRVTAKLYLLSPSAFIFFSKIFGGRRSLIEKTDYKPFEELFEK